MREQGDGDGGDAMSSLRNDATFFELLDAVCDGSATAAQYEALSGRVSGDAEAAMCYVTYLHQHADLYWRRRGVATGLPAGRIVEPIAVKRTGHVKWAMGLAAMILLALGMATFFKPVELKQDLREPRIAGAVALLSDVSSDASFGESTLPTALGSDLPPGRLELKTGSAQVMFRSGAVVDLVGPCAFEMTGSNRGRLDRGLLHAVVPRGAVGFCVTTPHAQVIDLSTAFDVDVRASDQTVVHVTQGHVRVIDLRSERGLFWKGDRVVIGPGGIGEVTRGAIFDSIATNSKLHYAIAAGRLGEDAVAHTDRDYQWNGVTSEGMPRELVGAEYIQTPMGDKANHELKVTLTLTRPAALYVFMSDREAPPDWVTEAGFVDTGWTIGLDNSARGVGLGVGAGASIDLTYRVWRLSVRGPGDVVLGPAQMGSNSEIGTYGIAAVEPDVTTRNTTRSATGEAQ
ncbi:MAG: hypothetical protein GC162_05300 [Planctomycetes bacterium]|nr:hypothetical protein [Planctomycetota bacterium]